MDIACVTACGDGLDGLGDMIYCLSLDCCQELEYKLQYRQAQ